METLVEIESVCASPPWFLYLLECKGNRLYAGISPDPQARFRSHQSGKGAKFTRGYPPLRMLALQAHADRSAASVAEHRLKQLTRAAKLNWAAQWPVESLISRE